MWLKFEHKKRLYNPSRSIINECDSTVVTTTRNIMTLPNAIVNEEMRNAPLYCKKALSDEDVQQHYFSQTFFPIFTERFKICLEKLKSQRIQNAMCTLVF